MKFYDCTPAPSPRRVRIFLAEKGVTVPVEQVDLRNGAQFSPEFKAINPWCTVPALILDDGTTICEASVICRYLEEVFPDPPLIGRTPTERAVIGMWDHYCEIDGFFACAEAFRNKTPGFRGRALAGPVGYEQIPALAERGQARVMHFLERLDARLSEVPFVGGEIYSMADITAAVTIEFAAWMKLTPPETLTHLRRWHDAISQRPSMKA